MKLVIAARKSDLARLQAYQVGDALRSVEPQLEIKYKFSTSLGDQNQDDPLWKIPEKGVFTSDLKEQLIQKQVDMVVHSWKDLPTEKSLETKIAGTLKREDVRDLLLVSKSAASKLRVLSSSPRRAHHLSKLLPEILPIKDALIEFKDVRGNIATRLSKLLEGEGEALVVAKAAMDRFLTSNNPEFDASLAVCKEALKKCHWVVLPIEACPPAAAQGSLAIEVLNERNDLLELVQQVSCVETYNQTQIERDLLASYGGGCHQKIGVSVLDRPWGRVTTCTGVTEGGEEIRLRTFTSSKQQSQKQVTSYFPKNRKEAGVYDRTSLNLKFDKMPQYLYLARANALPEDIEQKDLENSILWVSGLQSWAKLAARGIWVNGCSESLGEVEDMRLEGLLGSDISWVKFTHKDAQPTHIQKSAFTYELVHPDRLPDVEGCSHFYWMSYFSFVQFSKAYPSILHAEHACGPGNTYELIKKHLGSEQSLTVFLSYDDWLIHMKESVK